MYALFAVTAHTKWACTPMYPPPFCCILSPLSGCCRGQGSYAERGLQADRRAPPSWKTGCGARHERCRSLV